jgi:prephenate dehydrogenase
VLTQYAPAVKTSSLLDIDTRTVLIHGTGLLGASIGLAMRSEAWRVLGWDPDPTARGEALRRGALDSAIDSPAGVDADLVVLAAPPEAVVRILEEMRTSSLVTDVASVKTSIVTAAGHLPHFVGGHPMAGGETSGAGLASSSLFHGATWVLTSDNTDPKDLETMKSIVATLGANPLVMTAREHDAAVARVSHLPHLLAAALVHIAAGGGRALDLVGGGFRDLTRVAAADSGWWAEVLAANANEVGSSIRDLMVLLDTWAQDVEGRDLTSIQGRLDLARRVRSSLGGHHAQVRVILLDEPGEIARVGHALETSGVDVRDFQLRHGEHGGGGILTISVRAADHGALITALVDQGFELEGNEA